MPLVPYDDHSGIVYDVDLDAPPRERWIEAAGQFGDKVHKLLAHVDEALDEHLLSETSPHWRSILSPLIGVAKPLAGLATRYFGQDYAMEIRGISDAVGAPYGDLAVANIIYDLHQASQSCGACSSASFITRSGKPVLARNLDWSVPDSVGEHTVICRFHRRGGFYTSIGVAGFVGVLSAQRNGAWAATLNQAPASESTTQWTQTPACMHLRAACDRSMTFASLIRKIMTWQTMSPFFAHVVGTERHEQVVVNGFGTEYSKRHAECGVLVQTNHFVHDDDEHLNPTRGVFEEDGELVYEGTYPRYDALVRRMKKQKPATIEAAQRLLKGPPVTHEDTMQSMVLCPSASRIMLSVRPNEEWAAKDWYCESCGRSIHVFQGPGDYECPYCDENIVID